MISRYLNERLMEDNEQTTPTTKSFLKWFGKSKVVDKKGNPKVMYHGTKVEFKIFRTNSEMGVHVGDIDAAKSIVNYKSGAFIMPLYVRLERPLRMPDVLVFDPSETIPLFEQGKIKISKDSVQRMRAMYDEAIQMPLDSADEIKKAEKYFWDTEKFIVDEIKKNGYDGIVYKNQREGNADSYILFDANQVKSIHNKGSWSTSNDDIYK